jgi:hypothetical protein
MLRLVVWLKFTGVSKVLDVFVFRAMMEAAITSKTLVKFYHTRRNIEEVIFILAAMRT